MGDDEQGIGGIEAESHDVEFRHAETIVRGAEGMGRELRPEESRISAADGGRGLRRGEEQTDYQDNCSASYKDHA